MKADPKADAAAAPSGSKKKLIIMILAAVLVLGAGAGAGWYFTQGAAAHGEEEDAPAKESKKKKKKDPDAKAEYVPIESFTVNLQPENGEQYLQVQFTLQVAGENCLGSVPRLACDDRIVQARIDLSLMVDLPNIDAAFEDRIDLTPTKRHSAMDSSSARRSDRRAVSVALELLGDRPHVATLDI